MPRASERQADFSGLIHVLLPGRTLRQAHHPQCLSLHHLPDGRAMITALVFVFLFGPSIIDNLRVRQGKGQPIRSDGPQSHLVTKKGTPTMGGLMIVAGILVSTLLWAN